MGLSRLLLSILTVFPILTTDCLNWRCCGLELGPLACKTDALPMSISSPRVLCLFPPFEPSISLPFKFCTSLEKVAQDFPSCMFSLCFLVAHNTRGSGQHNVPKLVWRKQIVLPLFQILQPDIKSLDWSHHTHWVCLQGSQQFPPFCDHQWSHHHS